MTLPALGEAHVAREERRATIRAVDAKLARGLRVVVDDRDLSVAARRDPWAIRDGGDVAHMIHVPRRPIICGRGHGKKLAIRDGDIKDPGVILRERPPVGEKPSEEPDGDACPRCAIIGALGESRRVVHPDDAVPGDEDARFRATRHRRCRHAKERRHGLPAWNVGREDRVQPVGRERSRETAAQQEGDEEKGATHGDPSTPGCRMNHRIPPELKEQVSRPGTT
jgi:hypothetical protein